MAKKTKKNSYDIMRTVRFGLFLAILVSFPIILPAVQKQQNIKQYASPALGPQTPNLSPADTYVVYGDGLISENLRTGWSMDLVYGDHIDLTNRESVYFGTMSMKFAPKGQFEYIGILSNAALDISPYTYLTFVGQAEIPLQSYSVELLGPTKQRAGNLLYVKDYGGPPSVKPSWTVWNIPLSAFGAGTQITGIKITDANGGGQTANTVLFIDNVAFSKKKGEDIQPPPGLGAPSPPGATPTRIPDYYPYISPWVFIIPGLIIFMAVIFQ